MSILNNSICVSNVGLQSRPATSPDETWGEGDGHCAPQTLAGQMGACTRTGGKRAIVHKDWRKESNLAWWPAHQTSAPTFPLGPVHARWIPFGKCVLEC